MTEQWDEARNEAYRAAMAAMTAKELRDYQHQVDMAGHMVVMKALAWDVMTGDELPAADDAGSDLAVKAIADLHAAVREYMSKLNAWTD